MSGRGVDAVLGAIEQLSGYPMPASAVESMILPARVADYSPSMLDELTAAGEIYWIGDGPIGDSDGWVRWCRGSGTGCGAASRSSIAARSSLRPWQRRCVLLRRLAAPGRSGR